MVRRGSTVRVRQRASRKSLQNGSFCCLLRRSASASRVQDGYLFGRVGASGHTAASRDHFLGLPNQLQRRKAPANKRSTLPVLAQTRPPPSLERTSTNHSGTFTLAPV